MEDYSYGLTLNLIGAWPSGEIVCLVVVRPIPSLSWTKRPISYSQLSCLTFSIKRILRRKIRQVSLYPWARHL